MKLPRKSRLNRYYDLYTDKYSSLERKVLRETCDPNRIYDAKPVDVGAVKAVRLG